MHCYGTVVTPGIYQSVKEGYIITAYKLCSVHYPSPRWRKGCTLHLLVKKRLFYFHYYVNTFVPISWTKSLILMKCSSNIDQENA